MSELWDYFKGLFQQAKASSPTQPLIHELISRTEAEKEDFAFWQQTQVGKRLTAWVHEQYTLSSQAGRRIDQGVDFLDTPSSKGFVVYFRDTRYSEREATHFFDWLKAQVLRLNYRTQISDLRSYERADWVETVQRHYLKPRPAQNEQGKLLQGFGNITIELTFRNEQVQLLKFSATTYQDRQYHAAGDFADLLKVVLAW